MARHMSCLLLLFSILVGHISSEDSVSFLIGSLNGFFEMVHYSNKQNTRKIITTNSIVRRVDFHYNKNLVFARDDYGTLYKYPLFPTENSTVEVLMRGICFGFAVDWVYDRIFLASCSGSSSSINTVNLEGRQPVIVKKWGNIYDIRYIVVDPYCGKLFWVRNNKVETSRTDGQHFRTEIVDRNMYIDGIAADIPNERLFYAAFVDTSGTICSVDYCGNDLKIHLHMQGIVFGMAVNRGVVYWVSTNNHIDVLYKASLNHPITQVVKNFSTDYVWDIKVVDPELQKPLTTLGTRFSGCFPNADADPTMSSEGHTTSLQFTTPFPVTTQPSDADQLTSTKDWVTSTQNTFTTPRSTTDTITATTDSVSATYVGCFGTVYAKEQSLDHEIDDISLEKCINYCVGIRTQFAGVEERNNICYCGNTLAKDTMKSSDNLCSDHCSGYEGLTCGGDSVMTLYSISSSLYNVKSSTLKSAVKKEPDNENLYFTIVTFSLVVISVVTALILLNVYRKKACVFPALRVRYDTTTREDENENPIYMQG